MPRRHATALLYLALGAGAVTGCGNGSGASAGSGDGSAGAGGGAPAGADAGSVRVELTEYAVAAGGATAPAGEVRFDVHNAGTIPHDLVVIRTPKAAADLLRGGSVDTRAAVGRLSDTALTVKATKTLALDLKPGHYALVCDLPGHYEGGMHTDFTVG